MKNDTTRNMDKLKKLIECKFEQYIDGLHEIQYCTEDGMVVIIPFHTISKDVGNTFNFHDENGKIIGYIYDSESVI